MIDHQNIWYFCNLFNAGLIEQLPGITQYKYKLPYKQSMCENTGLISGFFFWDNGAWSIYRHRCIHTNNTHTHTNRCMHIFSPVFLFFRLPGADRTLSYTPSAQPVPILQWYCQHFQPGGGWCQSMLHTHTLIRTHARILYTSLFSEKHQNSQNRFSTAVFTHLYHLTNPFSPF